MWSSIPWRWLLCVIRDTLKLVTSRSAIQPLATLALLWDLISDITNTFSIQFLWTLSLSEYTPGLCVATSLVSIPTPIFTHVLGSHSSCLAVWDHCDKQHNTDVNILLCFARGSIYATHTFCRNSVNAHTHPHTEYVCYYGLSARSRHVRQVQQRLKWEKQHINVSLSLRCPRSACWSVCPGVSGFCFNTGRC